MHWAQREAPLAAVGPAHLLSLNPAELPAPLHGPQNPSHKLPYNKQMVKENEKARALEQELEQMPDDSRIIVFANTKRQVHAGVLYCIA